MLTYNKGRVRFMLTRNQFKNLLVIFVIVFCGLFGKYLASIGVNMVVILLMVACVATIAAIFEIVMTDFFVHVGLIEKKQTVTSEGKDK